MTRMTNAVPSRSNRALYAVSLVVLALGTSLVVAAEPKSLFGSALITGADNRISVTRVPVIDSTGKVTYKEVTIDFEVSSTGVLTLAPSSPTITPSPSLITSGFKAGKYKDARGNKYVVTGPSVIPNTTRTTWSLAFTTGPDATQFSMSWTTGPIAGHPNQSSLTARSITTEAYSWGIVGSEAFLSGYFPFIYWGNHGYVVGAAQAGGQLVLHLFSDLNNVEDGSVSLLSCTAC